GQRLIGLPELQRLQAERRRARPEPPIVAQSSRNRFPGIVTRVERDRVAAVVEVQAGPHRLVSLMTAEAARELGLRPGVAVFASADAPNMQKVVDAQLVDGSPSVFAGNHLEIAVAPGNPKRIAALADLARPGIIVIVAAPTVPAGRYALESLNKAGVSLSP